MNSGYKKLLVSYNFFYLIKLKIKKFLQKKRILGKNVVS